MRYFLFVLVLVSCPAAARAHGAVPGMQGLYQGLLHPFTVAPQFLASMAIALMAVQQRLRESAEILYSFVIASIVGVCLAARGVLDFSADFPLLIVAVVGGLLAASALHFHRFFLWIVGGLAGLLSGIISLPDPGPVAAMTFTAAGTITGATLLIAIVMALLQELPPKLAWAWLAIATRVAGSWIAAISILLSALMFRGKFQ